MEFVKFQRVLVLQDGSHGRAGGALADGKRAGSLLVRCNDVVIVATGRNDS